MAALFAIGFASGVSLVAVSFFYRERGMSVFRKARTVGDCGSLSHVSAELADQCQSSVKARLRPCVLACPLSWLYGVCQGYAQLRGE